MGAEPRNWTGLRASAEEGLAGHLDALKADARRAALVLDRPASTLTAAFDGSPEHLACVFAVGGQDLARGACHLASEALPRLLSYGDEPPNVAPSSAVGVLSYVAVLRCLGGALPAGADGLETRWLPILASRPRLLASFRARAAALAAVATGAIDLVPALDGGGPLAGGGETGGVSGLDVAGVTRRLAGSVASHHADAAGDAWRAFLQAFPLAITAERGTWVDLVWAAIAMKVQIEERPVADVGSWLPALVKELD